MKYTTPEITFVLFESEEVIVASAVLPTETVTEPEVIGGDEE